MNASWVPASSIRIHKLITYALCEWAKAKAGVDMALIWSKYNHKLGWHRWHIVSYRLFVCTVHLCNCKQSYYAHSTTSGRQQCENLNSNRPIVTDLHSSSKRKRINARSWTAKCQLWHLALILTLKRNYNSRTYCNSTCKYTGLKQSKIAYQKAANQAWCNITPHTSMSELHCATNCDDDISAWITTSHFLTIAPMQPSRRWNAQSNYFYNWWKNKYSLHNFRQTAMR